ncbi:MAG TPA: proline dehydrogenase family protein, partial [Myxococcota bacterium]|nr:proline dehydrogenase family protein [Myxococcota bacterium]
VGLLEAARMDGVRAVGGPVARAAEVACELALELLTLARLEETRAERRLERRLMRLMRDEAGRRLTLAFTDQALRPTREERVAEQLKYLLRREGIPNYFSRWERLQLSAFRAVGTLAPGWVVPRVIDKLEDEVARVTLPAQEPELSRAIAKSNSRGARVNLNHLGEAILGDAEAKKRHATYLKTLAREDIAAISIKVSSVVAQLEVLGWERALAVLRERIGLVYREARARGDKLVTLDMEEYRDLELTFELLSRLVMEDEHLQVHAGVVLQAYLPDGAPMLERLVALSQRRLAAGGRRLRLRLVKGANLAMERVDASLHGFVQAPYADKADVDANFKRMLLMALEAARRGALEVGVGSHNLFDLSFAMTLRAMYGLDREVGFEMLEG